MVNLARTTPATCALVVRHLDRPGVLAGVLDAIRAAEINVQEMENIIFEGAQAAVARIHLETAPGAGSDRADSVVEPAHSRSQPHHAVRPTSMRLRYGDQAQSVRRFPPPRGGHRAPARQS